MKNRKFIACLVGCIIITWVTLAGKMTGDVALALSVVIGGFYGGDTMITRAALQAGKGTP